MHEGAFLPLLQRSTLLLPGVCVRFWGDHRLRDARTNLTRSLKQPHEPGTFKGEFGNVLFRLDRLFERGVWFGYLHVSIVLVCRMKCCRDVFFIPYNASAFD